MKCILVSTDRGMEGKQQNIDMISLSVCVCVTISIRLGLVIMSITVIIYYLSKLQNQDCYIVQYEGEWERERVRKYMEWLDTNVW